MIRLRDIILLIEQEASSTNNGVNLSGAAMTAGANWHKELQDPETLKKWLSKYEISSPDSLSKLAKAALMKLDPITGSYVAPKGDYDALHSFNRRKSDGFGGKLNSIVANEIKRRKEQFGIDKIDIIGMDIDINGTTFEVKWKVYVAPSTDGHSYEEIDSRGSAGGNAEARAKGQIKGMHQYHTGTPVKLFTYDEKINGVQIYQIFYKYQS